MSVKRACQSSILTIYVKIHSISNSYPQLPLNYLIGETSGRSLVGYMKDASMCLAGYRSDFPYTVDDHKCQYALMAYICYASVNIAFNICLLALTKIGSSVQTWIVIRLVLPATLIMLFPNIWPLLKPSEVGINGAVLFGTALAITGAVLFRWASIEADKYLEQNKKQIPWLWPLRYSPIICEESSIKAMS